MKVLAVNRAGHLADTLPVNPHWLKAPKVGKFDEQKNLKEILHDWEHLWKHH